MYSIHKASPLRGEVTIPGDKSISHRSVMFGALARGTTRISGFLNGQDCLSTVDCFRRMGIRIDLSPDGHSVTVAGKGMRGLTAPDGRIRLYTGNSGTTTRIISGILAPQPFTSILSGDSSVNRRPMGRIISPLGRMGADIRSLSDNGCAPLEINGRPLHGTVWRSPVASAQVKSAVLCAGLYADSPTVLIEPSLSRDHTERMLASFGADITSEQKEDGWHASVEPCEELYARDITVPGDISSAAYFIAAASLVPGSELLIRNTGTNPTRAGILQAARAMGADIRPVSETMQGEPAADLLVRTASLKGTVIEGSLIPALIDELPVLAVMAAAAEGETVIRDAAELKVKESDRIATVTEGLRAMGADITPTDDGMIIRGGRPLHGALIHTYGDHRLAMSFAVAGM
ncbi:MAG TPA: 3-phosphoshikimate 1-carboxyvinyltransferase, partial [Lachnospiraceae bacterium]|nr:3-phosphoshikimate 1-carboxyvinyltransferase [Lachnospiraceae bacterium]